MTTFDLHRSQSSISKANYPLDALKDRYDTTDIIDGRLGDGVQVFWGLGHGNYDKVKKCIEYNRRWMFVDMPYFFRWQRYSPDWSKTMAHWRFIPDSLHPTRLVKLADTRDHQLKRIPNLPISKSELLILPSSDTMTRFHTGETAEEWVIRIRRLVAMAYPEYRIRVRFKPRGNGTSGPDAPGIDLISDLLHSKAVVSLASIAGVEAYRFGIPVISENPKINPVGDMAINISDKIRTPTSTQMDQVISNLLSHQYTPSEVRDGKLDQLLACYSLT